MRKLGIGRPCREEERALGTVKLLDAAVEVSLTKAEVFSSSGQEQGQSGIFS